MSNNTNTQAVTFWNFISKYKVEIPIIQRDYAQGRLGKENLRKNFLADLKNALDNSETMKLDFVYGSTEKDKLNPLDGQQRLTTLWLLHWYIALRAGKLNEDNCKVFRNFTYETRISSREFCQNLCVSNNFKDFEDKDIVGFITKQTWFYSAWKQDPTIQSMLRMLGGTKVTDKKEEYVDGIEDLFEGTDTDNFIDYWKKLSADNAPIVFYHLPLKDFGLSDDLYIKMNARGKQLTSFENFKADLIGYITKQSENETKGAEWDNLLDAKNGIPIKLDTDWTDIFWKNRSNDNQIDEIYFAFLNRFFLNYRVKNLVDENDKWYLFFTGGKSEYGDNVIAYETLDEYKTNGKIDKDLFIQLQTILNNYCVSQIDEKSNILKYSNSWNPKFYFIPQYNKENQNKIKNNKGDLIWRIYNINQKERVVFYAICKFFIENPVKKNGMDSFDYFCLKRWMRFVWNLVSVQSTDGRDYIRSIREMKNAIDLIDKVENTHKVYECLSKLRSSDFVGSIIKEQFAEEIEKAKKILDEKDNLRNYDCSLINNKENRKYDTWEDVIIEAENNAFFKGSIRFLFTGEDGENNWDFFDKKWSIAKKWFTDKRVTDNTILLKNFLFTFTSGDEHLLNEFVYDNSNLSWRNILLKKELCKQTHLFLSNEMKSVFDNYKSNFKKKETKLLQEELIKTDILKEMTWAEFGLRFNNEHYYFVPFNARAEWKKYVLATPRNKILTTLYREGKISFEKKEDGSDQYRLNDSGFYWGWNIKFQFNEKWVHWDVDSQGKEYLYLDEHSEKAIVIEDYFTETSQTILEKLKELLKK